MSIKVFVDGQEGMIGFKIFEYLLVCSDIEILCIEEVKCKDVDECCCLINVFDVMFLCLLDVVLCEFVLFVENLNIMLIDVSIVFCIYVDWVYGLFELICVQCEKICMLKCIVVFGCYVLVFVFVMWLFVDVGIVVLMFVVYSYLIIGYSGGGKLMIVEYESVVLGGKFVSLCLYVFGFVYKYLFEMVVYIGFVNVLIFMLIVGLFLKGFVVMIYFMFGQFVKCVMLQDVQCVFVEYYVDEVFVCVVLFDVDVNFDSGFFDVQVNNDMNCVDLFVFGNVECFVMVVCFDNFGKGVLGVVIQCMNFNIGVVEDVGFKC